MVREILFATDFSAASETAGRVAAEYARLLHARLHLLHVVTDGEGPASAALTQLAEQIGTDVELVTATAPGSPAEEIVRYARAHAVDLIVVGTHGRTGVTRALLGSVAERVMRSAPCPVLTVPRLVQAGGASVKELEAEPHPSLRHCLACGNPAEDLICGACRARIRGEALEHKRDEEKRGQI